MFVDEHTIGDGGTLIRSSQDLNGVMARNSRADISTLDISNRSIESVLATENAVLSFNMLTFSVEDDVLLMRGLEIPEQIPLVDEHQLEGKTIRTVFGSVRNMRIENDELIGRNFFSSAEDTKDAWTKVREGHVTDNSVRYKPLEWESIQPGESKVVFGRKYTASAEMVRRIVTKWQLRDNSLTSVGADQMAKMRSQLDNKTIRSNVMSFEQWLMSRGYNLETIDEAEKTKLRTEFDGLTRGVPTMDFNMWLIGGGHDPKTLDEVKKSSLRSEFEGFGSVDPILSDLPKKPPKKAPLKQTDAQDVLARAQVDEGIAARAVSDERERIAAIGKLGKQGNVEESVVRSCIESGKTVAEAQSLFFQYVTNKEQSVSAPGIMRRDHTVDCARMEVVALLRSGYDGQRLVEDKDYGEQVVNQADSMRGMTLMDMCRFALQIEGKDAPMNPEELWSRAAFSTMSLPQTISNVANKSMLLAYKAMPDTWRQWCSIGTVGDFKNHRRIRPTQSGKFLEIGQGGEVKHMGRVEEYEDNRARTFAGQFGITREDFINNNVDKFTSVPADMGRIAKMDLADLVYEVFMSNAAMSDAIAAFHADHNNLNASNAFDADGVKTALAVFRNVVDITGRPIDIEPRFVLVPPALEYDAKTLFSSDKLIAVGVGSSAATAPDNNIYKNLVVPIVETRLSNASFTNYSTSTWYMSASPSEGAKNVEVVFLNGVQTPVMERFQTGPNYVGGIIIQMYFDAGAAQIDYRTQSKNTS